MPHDTPLIGTVVAGLVAAFLLGALAQRMRVPPIVGYLVAGVIIGPFTPGFVADARLAGELAEIGVVLLMFGVGLHFSLRDLLSVRNIAVPGALVQIVVATAMGMGLAHALGWGLLAGFVFGLSLSVASTVVLLRALQARNMIETERGRIAVGWLIVEDLAMILALVLLPVIAEIAATPAGRAGPEFLRTALGVVLKVAGFIALMLVVGRRVIPLVLHWVVHTGSRELFRLAVLAIALGVAFGAAYVFDVSFALGAFFAGMILGETHLSRRATEETLPLRDAFAVLFFVSVGMLFDPAIIVEQPLPLLGTVAIIVIGKSVAAFAIVKAFRLPTRTATAVSVSLAQIGEFSFILAGLGASLGILPPEGRDLILAGAIISIFLNPFLFSLAERVIQPASAVAPVRTPAQLRSDRLKEELVVLIGYGRVGRRMAERLKLAGRNFVLIEDEPDAARAAEQGGHSIVRGNATDEAVLKLAGIEGAGKLLIAIPEGFEGGAIAERARRLNPSLVIIARAHSDAEVEHLGRLGADQIVMGEQEIANRMFALVSQAPAAAPA